jgi:predicted  nucleic acid-binding Zn-ribbon protein
MQGFRELIQLHLAHEIERTAIKRQEALRQRIAAMEADLGAARQALEAADGNVKRLHLERRSAEMDVQKLEDLRKKYREQLMSAKTNEIYKTLIHEIETAGHAISVRETAVLEVLEAADLAATAVSEAKKAVAAAEGRVADEERKLLADVEALEVDCREARRRAAALEPDIPVAMLSHYHRIRESRDGRGMALATGHECGECRVAVLPQAWVNLIVKEEPFQCAGCKRLLYRQEQLASADATAPQPASNGSAAG